MRNIFGNQPVFGDNFHGREEFVKQLVGILLSGNSFLLLGLRRIGKSSTVTEAIHQIKKKNKKVTTIELNCQNYKSIEDFYKELNLALPRSWQQQLRKALKTSKRIPGKLIDFITDHVEEVDLEYIGSVKLRKDAINYSNPIKEEITRFFSKQEEQIILFVDEQKNQHTTALEIESILTILRSWREAGVAQGICGSINLHIQLEQLGISRKLLAGVNTQLLPEYTREEAHGLINALAISGQISLRPVDIIAMLDLMPDYIPQFIQYFFFVIKTHWNGDITHIVPLYEKYVYPTIVRDFEYQFNDRLSKFSRQHLPIVRQIFNMLLEKKALPEATILTEVDGEDGYHILLQLLNNELIILNEDQTYSFALHIVAQWWAKKKVS